MEVTKEMKKLAEKERNGVALFPTVRTTDSLGTGYMPKVEDKPMSDNLAYCTEKENNTIQRAHNRCMMGIRTRKINQVKRWASIIKRLQAEIETIKADTSISASQKESKIKRRNDIIEEYTQNITNAQKFMGIDVTKTVAHVR